MIIQGDFLEFTPFEMISQILFGITFGILIVFGLELLGKYYKADKKARKDVTHVFFLIIAIALIGYSFYIIVLLLQYYPVFYNLDWLWTLNLILLSVIIIPVGFIPIRYLITKEKYSKRLSLIIIFNFIYLFIIFFIELIDTDSSLIFEDSNLLLYYLINFPPYIIDAFFGLLAFYSFIKIFLIKLKPLRVIKFKLIMSLFSLIIVLVGNGINHYFAINYGSTNPFFLLGSMISFTGWILVRYFVGSIPSYSEIEWRKSMIELHIIHSISGISLYSHEFYSKKSFTENNENDESQDAVEKRRIDSDLVGGGIVGIKGLLGEISGDRGKLSHITIEKRILIFRSGDYITCFLLSERNLGVYYSILDDLVREIEDLNPYLKDFVGNLAGLNIAPIVKKAFE